MFFVVYSAVEGFCAGIGYLFLRRMEKCIRLRGKMVLRLREMPCGIFLRVGGGCVDAVIGDFVYIYGVIFNVCWL